MGTSRAGCNVTHGKTYHKGYKQYKAMITRASKRDDCEVMMTPTEFCDFVDNKDNGWFEGCVVRRTKDKGNYEFGNFTFGTKAQNNQDKASYYKFMKGDELIEGHNLTAYCKEQGLSLGKMSEINRSKIKKYKEYRSMAGSKA